MDDALVEMLVEEAVNQVNCCVKNEHGFLPVLLLDSNIYSQTIAGRGRRGDDVHAEVTVPSNYLVYMYIYRREYGLSQGPKT